MVQITIYDKENRIIDTIKTTAAELKLTVNLIMSWYFKGEQNGTL